MRIEARRMMGSLVGIAVLGILTYGTARVVSGLLKPWKEEGFHFSILFRNVQGLRKGSLVVFRGMEVGTVSGFEIFEGGRRINVKVRLKENARFLVKTTTQCWIVRPRLSLAARKVSGLETLIRDSYINLRARSGGAYLKEGGMILGLESPPKDLTKEELGEPGEGALPARALLPENKGPQPGRPVVFRGIAVGTVRDVRLCESGNGVVVFFVVRKAYRSFARRKSRFWISRPRIKGSLIGGATVEDLETLVVPALAFDMGEGEDSEPAPDNKVFIGLAFPPEKEGRWRPKPGDAEKTISSIREMLPDTGTVSPFVEVHYSALEKDTFSADDRIRKSGEGVIFEKNGEFYVLTARSACDGRFLVESHWYDRTRIAEENISVYFKDGRIISAERIWVHGSKDLALLKLKGGNIPGRIRIPDWRKYLSFEGGGEFGSRDFPPGRTPILLKKDSKVSALLGCRMFREEKKEIVPFSLLPSNLRP